MVGKRDRDAPIGHQRIIGADCLRVPGVKLTVLARQQILVHNLLYERVPELITVRVRDQHVPGHSRAQCTGQVRIVQAAHLGQQCVPDSRTAWTGHPKQIARLLGQALNGCEHHVTQGRRHGQLAADEVLDKERIALATPEDEVHLSSRLARVPGSPPSAQQLPAGQPRQLPPLDPPDPAKLGE